MSSFIAVNQETKKEIKVSCVFEESSNTWTLSTTLDYIVYSLINVVFHSQINNPKSVSKMLKICQDEITYNYSGDNIIVNINVDYIDDGFLSFTLNKVVQNYEEILMKKVSNLEDRLLFLEEENKNLKDQIYYSQSLEGTFYIKIDEDKGNFEYKAVCKNFKKQEDFEQKMLEAFKSSNIEYLNDFMNSHKQYISETSIDKIRKSIKKITKVNSIYEIWKIFLYLKIVMKQSTKWSYTTYSNGTSQTNYIDVNEGTLFIKVPTDSKHGYCYGSGLVNSIFNYRQSYPLKCGGYCGPLYSSSCYQILSVEESFYSSSIKFAFMKLEKKEDIVNLQDKILCNIKLAHESSGIYDTFGDFSEEDKKTWIYLFDL